MGRLLKQSVVVVNKAGAGGSVGAAQAARAAPDGYTILMALSSISVLPVADRLQGRPAAYELDQFAPIALVSADPTVLVVRADGPYKTLKDLVDAAKEKPGTINYGSSGVYGTLHVAMEIFAAAADIKLFHVPYQGGGPAVAALLAGQIDALASGPSAAIGQIKAGKMRALAVWGDKRLAAMPDVPSMKELGYDATFYIWSGLFAPAATPQPIMSVLRDTVQADGRGRRVQGRDGKGRDADRLSRRPGLQDLPRPRRRTAARGGRADATSMASADSFIVLLSPDLVDWAVRQPRSDRQPVPPRGRSYDSGVQSRASPLRMEG